MAHHLVRARNAYKDIKIRSFYCTHTRTHSLSVSLCLYVCLCLAANTLIHYW